MSLMNLFSSKHDDPVKVAVKICGLRQKSSVEIAVEYGAKYLGFVFFEKSPRNISAKEAAFITQDLHHDVKTVAVVVNPENSMLDKIFVAFKPDYLQLHGTESPERVKEIKKKYNIGIIKAFRVAEKEDLRIISGYNDVADMFLLDAKVKNADLPGGMGISFDWSILHEYKFKKEWFLSGGLNIKNVEKAIKATGTEYIDVSSGVESAHGIKDNHKISELCKLVGVI
jgi:phosphoribosylanthranilate isomerase